MARRRQSGPQRGNNTPRKPSNPGVPKATKARKDPEKIKDELELELERAAASLPKIPAPSSINDLLGPKIAPAKDQDDIPPSLTKSLQRTEEDDASAIAAAMTSFETEEEKKSDEDVLASEPSVTQSEERESRSWAILDDDGEEEETELPAFFRQEPENAEKSPLGKMFPAVLALAVIGFLVWWFVLPKPPKMPEEALVLVEPPEGSRAVLHVEEKETAFPASVDYISPRVIPPRVIEVEADAQITVAPPHVINPDEIQHRLPEAREQQEGVFRSGPREASGQPSLTPSPVRRPSFADRPTRNWSGIVLVPEIARVSMAYTSRVTLSRVEAHPLSDGRLHVWVRLYNVTDQDVTVEKDCRFRAFNENFFTRLGFEPVTIPAKGYTDAMFVSPEKKIEEYTILVRLDRQGQRGEGDEELLQFTARIPRY